MNKEKGATGVYILVFILLCGVIGAVFLFTYYKPCTNFNQSTLQTPTQVINLALADTSDQQSKGLGGCRYIPKNAGMYFIFGGLEDRTFWMKNMVIPIDIIWLNKTQVVGIEKNVPSFPLDTPDSELPTYTSPEGVDAVLEVGAGMAQKYGIMVGVELNIDPAFASPDGEATAGKQERNI